MSAMVATAAWTAIAATNPANLSMRGWVVLTLLLSTLYLRHISTLSRRPHNAPCPDHGLVFRLMYGLFSTHVCEMLLGYML